MKEDIAIAPAKIPISDELQQRIVEAAQQQERPPSEVLEDAVCEYLSRQEKWQRYIEKGEHTAREKGYTEDDVARLIEEVRAEKRTR